MLLLNALLPVSNGMQLLPSQIAFRRPRKSVWPRGVPSHDLLVISPPNEFIDFNFFIYLPFVSSKLC